MEEQEEHTAIARYSCQSQIIGDKGIFSLKVPLFHITQAGKYDDLLQAGTDFNALVSAHNEAIETMDFGEDSDGDIAPSVPNKRLTPSVSNIDNLKNKVSENG